MNLIKYIDKYYMKKVKKYIFHELKWCTKINLI